MPSCLSALSRSGSGFTLDLANRLGLPAVTTAVVVLVDGLGAEALASRAGHARTLASSLERTTHGKHSSTIDSGFPTTTAAALATLTTGTAPGQHGLVGYTVFDASNDRVVNQLTGWDAHLDPATWQLQQTIFEAAKQVGVGATAIGPSRYSNTGFTRAVLRGARYIVGEKIGDRFAHALTVARSPEPNVIYLYIPELDRISHASGGESSRWTSQLESIDAELRDFVAALGKNTGVLVTADHGSVDVPERSHVLIDSEPSLIAGVRFVAGEPRCLQLHFEKDLSDGLRQRVIEAWRVREGERSWVATRDEAIDAGWFGAVLPEVRPRIGDLLVAARKRIAYYDSRTASPGALAMIGQHGSWSQSEVRVPLLRYGAFAR
jgi:Type I phosphodiesterase / nucleotide pyrophosphatase